MKCFQHTQLVEWSTNYDTWKKTHKLKHLGLPRMMACSALPVGRFV